MRMKRDLAGYPVAWGEMDAFEHVNYIVYFRYFETVRIAYLEKLNVPEFPGRDPLGPILSETACRFRAALSYSDTVSIGARVASVGEDRFVMHYAVFSHRMGRLAAGGRGPSSASTTAITDRFRCRKDSRTGSRKWSVLSRRHE
jgi:acyl-CoA thioesterase FadM